MPVSVPERCRLDPRASPCQSRAGGLLGLPLDTSAGSVGTGPRGDGIVRDLYLHLVRDNANHDKRG